MKKIPVILLLAFFAIPAIYGQIKIGDNPQVISPTSVLELESNERVLVITRINTVQMDAIVPNQGAIIYNTDTQCIHYYDGATWINLCDSAFAIPENSISTEHIIDFSINGIDIQNGSIGPGKLQNQSVTQDKLSENSVGAFALDNDNINLSDFTNDLNLLTLSTATGNDITNSGGIFYDDQTLQDDITANTALINGHIAADADTNASNEIQNLTLTGNQLQISGSNTVTLPSTTGEIDDNELITNAVLTGTDLVITEAGTNFTVPLGSLAGGGGTTEVADLTTITGVGTGADPFKIEPGGNNQILTTNAGGVVAWQTIAAGGSTEEADQTTITGLGTNADPFKIEPGGNGQFLTTDTGGNIAWQTVAPGGSTEEADQTTITGLGTGVDPFKIEPGGNGQFLTTDTGGNVAWQTVAPGGSTEEADQTTITGIGTNADPFKIEPATPLATPADQMLITNGTTDAIEWAPLSAGGGEVNTASDAGVGGVGLTLTKNLSDLPFKNINAADTGILSVIDDAGNNEIDIDIIPATPLATPANQMLITNGTTDVVEWAPLPAGTPPTDAETDDALSDYDPASGYDIHVDDATIEIDTDQLRIKPATPLATPADQMLITNGATDAVEWAPVSVGGGEVNTGLNIGSAGIGPYVGNNTTVLEFRNINSASGIVSVIDDALNNEIDLDIADESITALKLNNMGATADGEILEWDTTANGGTGGWVVAVGGGAGTIVSADANNAIAASGNDGGAFYDDDALVAATAANAAAVLLKEDSANKSTDVNLADGTNTLFPTELAVKTYVDTQISSVSGGTNLSNTNLTQTAGNRTYDLPTNTDNLIFTGLGNVGIGNGANPPSNKLHVAGAIRAQGILNSNGTNGTPAYRFNGDSDTGMYSDVADDLAFSAGGQEILRLSESVADGLEIVATGTLELDDQLIDINGEVGTPGQVLSTTAAGVDWIDASTGGGEVNTGNNVGSGGVGPYITNNGVVLEFKNINAGSNKIVVADDAGNNEIDIDVNEANLTLNATQIDLSPAIDVDSDGNNESTVQEAIADLSTNKIIAKGIVPSASGTNGAYTINVAIPLNSVIQVSAVQNTIGNPMIIQITGQTATNFSVQIFEFDIPTTTYNQVNADWHYTIVNP